MGAWASDGLADIRHSDDLDVAPFRVDGETYGTAIWIWTVVVGCNPSVRVYNGVASR